MKTTLNKIRAHSPCETGWKKLLSTLGKTKSDDEPLSLRTILDSNGLDDALWCLPAVDGQDRIIRLYAVWCANQVSHLMTDSRSVNALVVAEKYANGLATEEELAAAWAAARAAELAAAWDAASAAELAAAWDAARAAELAAARGAASAAELAAAWAAQLAAARAAQLAAASAAELSAAWAAARGAASAAQEKELRRAIDCCEYGGDPYKISIVCTDMAIQKQLENEA